MALLQFYASSSASLVFHFFISRKMSTVRHTIRKNECRKSSSIVLPLLQTVGASAIRRYKRERVAAAAAAGSNGFSQRRVFTVSCTLRPNSSGSQRFSISSLISPHSPQRSLSFLNLASIPHPLFPPTKKNDAPLNTLKINFFSIKNWKIFFSSQSHVYNQKIKTQSTFHALEAAQKSQPPPLDIVLSQTPVKLTNKRANLHAKIAAVSLLITSQGVKTRGREDKRLSLFNEKVFFNKSSILISN